MEFAVETARLSFVVADEPEQRKEFETGALRTDDSGRPLFQVRLLAMDGKGSAPIKVGLVGDPGLTQGTFVRTVNLVLNAIDRRGDSVMWWTADRLEPVAGPGAPGAASAGPAAAAGKADAK